MQLGYVIVTMLATPALKYKLRLLSKSEMFDLNKIVNVTKIKDTRLDRWIKSETKFGL